MSDWRQYVYERLQKGLHQVTLVFDPDGLLLEEKIQTELKSRGVEVIPFKDNVSFRYYYEIKYRDNKQISKSREVIVLLEAGQKRFDDLPYDILKTGHKVTLSISEVFDKLSYPVLEKVGIEYFDKLYSSYVNYCKEKLSDNQTKDFILRHIFEISPEIIKNDTDLIKILLRNHYKKESFPDVIEDRLVELLKNNLKLKEEELKKLISNRDYFFSFLQERWPYYLKNLYNGNENKISECGQSTLYKFLEPLDVNFGHDDIKIYIDDFFMEGFLTPVFCPEAAQHKPGWESVGIIQSGNKNLGFDKLLSYTKQQVPSAGTTPASWLDFCRIFARLKYICYLNDIDEERLKFSNFANEVDILFTTWIKERYESLKNLASDPPIINNHLLRYFKKRFETSRNKQALILIDGMAYDQWFVIKDGLLKNLWNIEESAMFSWIPTLTSISRQALLSGSLPFYFSDSIKVTNKEEKLWIKFWQDAGYGIDDCLLEKNVNLENIEKLVKSISKSLPKYAGIVVNDIDNLIHAALLGNTSLNNQIAYWAKKSNLIILIDELLKLEYEVYLTSDHGNVEAKGVGRPKQQGVTVETRGERTRIYETDIFRRDVMKQFPEAMSYECSGLPTGFFPLFLNGRKAFITKDEKTISHGGLCLEEVIVPLIKISRKTI